jgi:hypothetical protein
MRRLGSLEAGERERRGQFQRWQVPGNGAPDNIGADPPKGLAQPVIQPAYVAPALIGQQRGDLPAEAGDSQADALKAALDGIPHQLVLLEGVAIEAGDVALDILDGVEDGGEQSSRAIVGRARRQGGVPTR